VSVLYFAFASNMVTAQMAERCPSAEPRGVAALEDHRFIIGRRGYATVVAEPGATVYGILWGLRPEHEAALDVYEGVRHGLYRKAWLPVRLADGTEEQAIVYVAGDPARGNAVAGYVEKVVASAEAHGLPAAYVAELRSWLPNHE
jgi:cation transport regulator ChaC